MTANRHHPRGASIVAILLAAGESVRMGSPKPLLDWGGQTLIEYQVTQLEQSGVGDVVVVLGHAAEDLRPVIQPLGVRIVVNERYAEGRASSLRCGASAIAGRAATIIVASVDQPRPAALIRRLLADYAGSGKCMAVPVHAGRRGHPVVADGELLGELRQVSDESQGLRALLARHADDILEVPFESPLVLLDINTPEQYEAAKAVYFAQIGE